MCILFFVTWKVALLILKSQYFACIFDEFSAVSCFNSLAYLLTDENMFIDALRWL